MSNALYALYSSHWGGGGDHRIDFMFLVNREIQPEKKGRGGVGVGGIIHMVLLVPEFDRKSDTLLFGRSEVYEEALLG